MKHLEKSTLENDIEIRSILALNHHWYNILLDYLSSKLTIQFSTHLVHINKTFYNYKNNSYIEAMVSSLNFPQPKVQQGRVRTKRKHFS